MEDGRAFEFGSPTDSSYLIANAVGDTSRLKGRNGCLRRGPVVGTAANEFEIPKDGDGRGSADGSAQQPPDVLVLPVVSIRRHGKPRLTFATPTVLAGDRSLSRPSLTNRRPGRQPRDQRDVE